MGLPLHRYTWGLDGSLFFPPKEKQPTVVYIARKCPAIEELKGLLRSRDPALVTAVEWRPLGDLPTQADYARAVREASVFVSLSSAEGLPASLLEAMAAGTLVAGYNGVGGQREFVGEGEGQNCILAENGDYVTLARKLEPALRGVMRGDHSAWKQVIGNGRETAALYTLAEEERSIVAAWEAIVASPAPAAWDQTGTGRSTTTE
jgi:glycosyltransferase involved in cell wall biosynthesis